MRGRQHPEKSHGPREQFRGEPPQLFDAMHRPLGAVVGVSNLHIYAAMRGQMLTEFQKTRNAPGALYSAAGTDAAPEQEVWARSPVTT